MIQNGLVAAVVLMALAYLIRRFFFKKANCDRCGMESTKKP